MVVNILEKLLAHVALWHFTTQQSLAHSKDKNIWRMNSLEVWTHSKYGHIWRMNMFEGWTHWKDELVQRRWLVQRMNLFKGGNLFKGWTCSKDEHIWNMNLFEGGNLFKGWTRSKEATCSKDELVQRRWLVCHSPFFFVTATHLPLSLLLFVVTCFATFSTSFCCDSFATFSTIFIATCLLLSLLLVTTCTPLPLLLVYELLGCCYNQVNSKSNHEMWSYQWSWLPWMFGHFTM